MKVKAILGFALITWGAACTVPNPGYEPADMAAADAGSPPESGHSVPPATDMAPKPTPTPSDASPPAKPDQPPQTTTPSIGQLCTSNASCPQGELCIFTDPNAAKGICLRKCKTLDKPCSVPDPQLHSGCAIYYHSGGQVKVCVIFCRFPDGQTFPCPNATDYRCKVFSNGLGMCAPKL